MNRRILRLERGEGLPQQGSKKIIHEGFKRKALYLAQCNIHSLGINGRV
jgi:hypothetical protein